MSIPDAVTTLIQLELRGLIVSVGGRYERRHRPAAPIARLSIDDRPSAAVGGCGLGRGMTEPSRGALRTTLPVDTQGDHPPGACMPEGLPRTEIELLRAFEDHLALERRLSPNTVAAYRGDLEQLATFLTRNRSSLGSAPVPAPAAIPRAAAHARVRARDDRAARGAIKTFYRWAVSAGRVETRPVPAPRAPEGRQPAPDRPPSEGGRAPRGGAGRSTRTTIPSSTPSPRAIVPSLELLYGSGLRVGEVATLTVDRIDVRRGRVLVLGKGSKEREVPISEYAADAVQRLPARRPPDDGSRGIASALLQ